MKYGFIDANRKNFALKIMTRVLSVTKAGYLAWKRRGPSARKQEDDVLREAGAPEVLTDNTTTIAHSLGGGGGCSIAATPRRGLPLSALLLSALGLLGLRRLRRRVA